MLRFARAPKGAQTSAATDWSGRASSVSKPSYLRDIGNITVV